MLTLDRVSKIYADGTKAVDGVTLSIPEGQFCVLLGHSGAGKSTILRLVNGLVKKSDGNIEVNGISLNTKSLPKIRRNVAMIHQDFNLSQRSTVAVNVMSGALAEVSFLRSMLGWFQKRIRRKCCELLSAVGLEEHHLHRRTSDLSGGQQQRVGIARSLMLDPQIILADEPIASLDPGASREIMVQLKKISRERNCTVVCCLHQVDFAVEFADRVIGVEDGKIVFDVSPENLDIETLKLIYKNYDDPAGVRSLKNAEIINVKDTVEKLRSGIV